MSYTKFLLIIVTTSITWSNCIVKSLDTNTTISINNINRTLPTIGEELKLEGNNKICINSGKINITCSNKKFDDNLTTDKKRCKRVNGNKSYFTYIEEIVKYFIHKSEIQQDSSGTRGESNNTIEATIELPKNLKTFIIKDKDWGPTPIYLTILNSIGKKKKEYENKDQNITKFEIPIKNLHNGDKLIITNKYNNNLAEITVKIKD